MPGIYDNMDATFSRACRAAWHVLTGRYLGLFCRLPVSGGQETGSSGLSNPHAAVWLFLHAHRHRHTYTQPDTHILRSSPGTREWLRHKKGHSCRNTHRLTYLPPSPPGLPTAAVGHAFVCERTHPRAPLPSTNARPSTDCTPSISISPPPPVSYSKECKRTASA